MQMKGFRHPARREATAQDLEQIERDPVLLLRSPQDDEEEYETTGL
jgi:hypothetical protein